MGGKLLTLDERQPPSGGARPAAEGGEGVAAGGQRPVAEGTAGIAGGRRLSAAGGLSSPGHRAATPAIFPLSSAVAAYHRVGRAEAMSDTAITQLRLLDEGLDLAAFGARFGQGFDDVYAVS